MASEPSRSNAAASGGASGGGAADSYIGSLISLTSKSEIRYEGVLFNIDTDEASIGLRNVRSFGTEGRRKDGAPQVPPIDKVYEYIVFRGSDIKDLQVKSSPPVQTAPPVHNDPAIIQSHYSPSAAPSSLPPATTTQIGGPVSDFGTQNPQPGISRPTYPNSTPLYPGGGNLPPATTTQIGGPVSDFGTQNPQPGLSKPTYPNSTPLYPGGGNLPPATTTQIGGPVSEFGTQNPQPGLSRPTYPSSTPLYPGGGNLPPATTTQIGGPVSDFGTQNQQPGLSRPTYPNSAPFYSGGGNLSAWNQPPPPTANSGGLSVPMYWPGHYPPSGSIQPQQQSLFRPVPGLSMPPQQQPLLRPIPGFPMQPTLQPPLGQQPVMYPNMNSSFPTGPPSMSTSQSGVFPPPLIQPVVSTTVSMPSTVMPVQSSALAVDSLSMMPSKAPPQAVPVASQTNLSMGSSTLASSQMPYNSLSDTPSSSSPALVTPGQFLQLGSTNSQTSQMAQKDVEVVPVSSMHSAPPPPAEMPMAAAPVPVSTETQAPLLPLPSPVNPKMNGVSSQTRYVNRGGHGRGRGSENFRSVPQYTEDFDFEAMNERFKKDEVWGHLGKSTVRTDDGLDLEEEEDVDVPETDKMPVYKKDDFFDSLSCNALDRESRNPRPRFSEQMRLDTETFGEFSRNRGFRGGRGPSRGGRSRGGYNGRGSGYGYGYGGRGRGQNVYRAI